MARILFLIILFLFPLGADVSGIASLELAIGIWVICGLLAVGAVLTWEPIGRHLPLLRRLWHQAESLYAQWPMQVIHLRLRTDDPLADSGGLSFRPVLLTSRADVELRRLMLNMRVVFGLPDREVIATDVFDVDDFGGPFAPEHARFHGVPLEWSWSGEKNGLRELFGLPRKLRAREEIPLPPLALRYSDRQKVADLLDEYGSAVWRWRMVADTDKGRVEMEVSVPLEEDPRPAVMRPKSGSQTLEGQQ